MRERERERERERGREGERERPVSVAENEPASGEYLLTINSLIRELPAERQRHR